MAHESKEPFPRFSPDVVELQDGPPNTTVSPGNDQVQATSPTTSQRRQSRSRSLVQNFVMSNPPLGMWQATGEVGSKVPTLPEIRDGSFDNEGWSPEGQLEHRGSNPHDIHRRVSKARKRSLSTKTGAQYTLLKDNGGEFRPSEELLYEEGTAEERTSEQHQEGSHGQTRPSPPNINNKNEKAINIMHVSSTVEGPDETGTYPNGYRFPKKHTWSQSTLIGLKAFWKFFITPVGFLVTIYGLNVVGWGAMIFFLLVEAAPAMCHPSCGDKYSARNVWIEIDAQVLTALFCVTAFGLIPWRFRDFYYLMKWRVGKDWDSHRRLAGIYRSWYRLPESNKLPESITPPPVYSEKNPRSEDDPLPYTAEELKELEDNKALPLPPTSIPDPPLTGFRAPPTKSWNLDIVIWMYFLNTWIQVPLCGIMWGMNRFNRPSWATGFLITIGCISGIVAGIVVFIEGSKIKKAEGIPVKEYDVVESTEDYQKRKAKEDAKEAHKESKRHHSGGPEVKRTEKLKGSAWFTRH